MKFDPTIFWIQLCNSFCFQAQSIWNPWSILCCGFQSFWGSWYSCMVPIWPSSSNDHQFLEVVRVALHGAIQRHSERSFYWPGSSPLTQFCKQASGWGPNYGKWKCFHADSRMGAAILQVGTSMTENSLFTVPSQYSSLISPCWPQASFILPTRIQACPDHISFS